MFHVKHLIVVAIVIVVFVAWGINIVVVKKSAGNEILFVVVIGIVILYLRGGNKNKPCIKIHGYY